MVIVAGTLRVTSKYLLLLIYFPPVGVPTALAQGVAALPPLSQPVLEVAAFRVAPVAAGATDTRSKNIAPGGGAQGKGPATREAGETELRTQKSDTWYDVLQRAAAALAIKLHANSARLNPSALPPLLPGKYLRAKILPGGALEIEYAVSASEAYALRLDKATEGGTWAVRPLAADPLLTERMRADPAKASLFTVTDAAGLPESVALQLTEIFAGEVDFLRELHLGYRCAIVYEALYREGFIENAGRILAAELEIGTRVYRAYYTPDAKGQGRYFDHTGTSAQRVFRRSPLEFTRVTSDYTLARFHPILGVWRAHLGVDYAAPTGTKVMSVADGVVEFAGPRGTYGNLVIVRHQERFRTYYAHLSAFAPKIAAGDKVAQGQTIGLVGMTGMATGPHLHFEFHERTAAGTWASVRAPDVIESGVDAAPGFAERVRAYRDSLTVAGQGNYLILE